MKCGHSNNVPFVAYFISCIGWDFIQDSKCQLYGNTWDRPIFAQLLHRPTQNWIYCTQKNIQEKIWETSCYTEVKNIKNGLQWKKLKQDDELCKQLLC